MPTMLEKSSFDTICHEHLEYYSLAVIERLAGGRTGSRSCAQTLNDVNGGSIRIFAGHAGRLDARRCHARRSSACAAARRRSSSTPRRRTTRSPQRTAGTRRPPGAPPELRAEGSTIHVYGASTKGNTILQFAGIDRVARRLRRRPEPRQVGFGDHRDPHPDRLRGGVARAAARTTTSCSPGTSSTSSSSGRHEFLARGGSFIVPLPDVRVIDGTGDASERPP